MSFALQDAAPQQTVQVVTDAMSGLQVDMNPFKDSKSNLDAWAGMDGWRQAPAAPAPLAPAALARPGVKGYRFYTGDDQADQRASVKGVNPYGSSWLSLAKSQLGAPYVWAAGTPGTGFDCSGFTQWLVKRVTGQQLEHHAATQAQQTQRIDRANLQPGDLLFFQYGDGGISHVEIYMGHNKMIGTANTTEDLDIDQVDWNNFVQGGRVPGMSGVGAKRGRPKGRIPKPAAGLPAPLMVPFAVQPQNYFSGMLPQMLANDPKNDPAKTGSYKIPSDYTTNDIKAYARAQVLAHGWSVKDYNALVLLWNRESGWNPNAVNSSSGATGIPQLLPAAHDIPAGWHDPKVQIAWGLKYIAGRYGSPSAAWAHSQQTGWY